MFGKISIFSLITGIVLYFFIPEIAAFCWLITWISAIIHFVWFSELGILAKIMWTMVLISPLGFFIKHIIGMGILFIAAIILLVYVFKFIFLNK